MTLFFLIRHGETDWSLNDKYQIKGGHRDLPPLRELGIKQAFKIASDPSLSKAQLIVSSPYTRALETAAILSRKLDLDIQVEYDLREWQPDLDLNIRNQSELEVAVKDYEAHKGVYPKGISKNWESKGALKERATTVLKKYLGYQHVIIVTHEQVIKSWIEADKIDHCKIYCLSIVK